MLCLPSKLGTQGHHPIRQLGKFKLREEVGLPEWLALPSLLAQTCPALTVASHPDRVNIARGARNQNKQGSSPLFPLHLFFFSSFLPTAPLTEKPFQRPSGHLALTLPEQTKMTKRNVLQGGGWAGVWGDPQHTRTRSYSKE